MIINNAFAQASNTQSDPLMTFLPLILMFVVLYFLMIRPQTKKAKEHKKMVESLSTGDEVVTGGGIMGKIKKVDQNYLSVEISKNVEVNIQKSTVQILLPKGTVKL